MADCGAIGDHLVPFIALMETEYVQAKLSLSAVFLTRRWGINTLSWASHPNYVLCMEMVFAPIGFDWSI